jgi:hypothetical protein
MSSTTLVSEVVADGQLMRLALEPRDDGSALATGAAGVEEIGLAEIPFVVAALFELHPAGFVDEQFAVSPAELDGLVNDGIARMLVLAAGDGEDVEAVVFDHEDLGYFVVEETDDPDRFEAATIRSLDVWTIICGVAAEVCGA